jgi:NAD(P)H-hydrate epimerase
MCHGIENPMDLDQLLTDTSIVALGPGLGQSDWAADLFEALIDRASLVLDADALNFLAERQQRR